MIGGWLPGEGKRSGRFGALVIGFYEDGELKYAGRVGTGFDEAELTRSAACSGRRARRQPVRRPPAAARDQLRRSGAGRPCRVWGVDADEDVAPPALPRPARRHDPEERGVRTISMKSEDGRHRRIPIGLGEMPMSLSSRPPEERSIRTIHAALDAGVNLIDTADAYARDHTDIGHGERLIAKALRGRRDEVIVATKGGHTATARRGSSTAGRSTSARPARRRCARSRPTGSTSTSTTGPTRRCRTKRRSGRSRSSRTRARCAGSGSPTRTSSRSSWRARSSTSSRCRTSSRSSTARRSARARCALCEERGIAFLPWSPLGGIRYAADAAGSHDPVRAAADAHGVSPQQVALAWLLALSYVMVPIPGASRPESILDSVKAVELELTTTSWRRSEGQ